MTELLLDIDTSDNAVQELVVRMLYWVCPGVRAVRMVDDARVLVDYEGADTAADVEAAMREAIHEITAGGSDFSPTTRYETAPKLSTPAFADPHSELVRRGWVSAESDGAFTYTGPLAQLFERLDELFVARIGVLNPAPARLPSLLAPQTLLRSEFLAGSAHTANFVFHLTEGRSVPSRFDAECVDTARSTLDLASLPDTARHPEAVLSPAACQPFFRALSGRTLATPQTVTARTVCYRYESGASNGLRRMREFSVRELIHVSTPDDVRRTREKMLTVASDLLSEIGLAAQITTASDPFFIDVTARMRMYQLAFEVKHELLAWIPFDGSRLAVGSVNLHEDHFGKAWSIRTADGEWAHSCCFGLGLDRWCFAVLAQYGLEPRDWPAVLRPREQTADAQ